MNSAIFAAAKNGKTAVVNIDDEAGAFMLEHANCRHMTYAIKEYDFDLALVDALGQVGYAIDEF